MKSSLIFNFNSIFSLVLKRLKNTLLEKAFNELENCFKNYWRAIIAIATSIHRSRELRSFFLDIYEKLIEPMKAANWTEAQVNNFLTAVTKCILDVQSYGAYGLNGPERVDIRCLWDRFMNVMHVCLLRMYQNTN